MVGYDMEALEQLDEAHRKAGTASDEAYHAWEEAQSAEWDAGEEREKKYNEALVRGLIIERVLDRSNVRYLAGYENEEAVWLHLNNAHAQSLQGVLAVQASVRLSSYTRSWREAGNQPQSPMQVSFEVPGEHSNMQIEARSDVTTKYRGPLEAIEWRLPTEEEIQNYAGSVAALAA